VFILFSLFEIFFWLPRCVNNDSTILQSQITIESDILSRDFSIIFCSLFFSSLAGMIKCAVGLRSHLFCDSSLGFRLARQSSRNPHSALDNVRLLKPSSQNTSFADAQTNELTQRNVRECIETDYPSGPNRTVKAGRNPATNRTDSQRATNHPIDER